MSLRILLVDDYAEWSRHVSVKLQNDLRYRVIGQVSDGLEALSAAERLEPDLVVLDIGLPTLNGIEVARRLLDCSPHSRILFLTENRSPEIAAAAIATGAYGYVVKSDASSDLLPAIGAIAEGKTFVRPRFARYPIDWTTVRRNPRRICHHDVIFSSDETSMMDGFARFVEDTLEAGGSAIFVATQPHRCAVQEKLQAGGTDIDAAVTEARYVVLGVDEMLSTFMLNGWPDEARFLRASTALITAASAASRGPYPRVACCGEAVCQLCEEGNVRAAIRLEQLWDDLAARTGVDVLCGYSQRAVRSEEKAAAALSAMHSTAVWR
jgi:CheY-like chemotaxis protein